MVIIFQDKGSKVEDNKYCDICQCKEHLKYFPLDSYSESSGNKIFYSGGIYFCKDCLSICEVCQDCGKPIATQIMEVSLKGWNTEAFCNCIKSEKEKIARYEKEASKYEYLQHQKKIDELKRSIEAKKIESVVQNIKLEDIEEYKFSVGGSPYLLDNCVATLFGITTHELRKVIDKNLNNFSDDDVVVLSGSELYEFQQLMPEYISSRSPYMLNLYGVTKLAIFIKNNKTEDFINEVIKSSKDNEFFKAENKLIQAIYDYLANNSYIKTQKVEKEQNYKDCMNENKELKDEQFKDWQTIGQLKSWILCLVLIIFVMLIWKYIV